MQAMNWALAAVLCLVALLVGAAIAGFLAYRKGVQSGVEQRKQQAEAAIGSAEKEAGRILEDAKKEAEAKRKNAMATSPRLKSSLIRLANVSHTASFMS